MDINASEAPVEEVKETEEVVEEPVKEVAEVKEEVVEDVKEEVVEEPVEEPKEEVVAVEEKLSEMDILKKQNDDLKREFKEMKDMLGGKKPKVEASKSTFDVESEISALIKAGNATPAMKEMLTKVAEQSEDAFKAMAASMPKFVSMKMESKLAKIEEQTKKPKKPKTWEEEYGEMAKAFRI